MRHIIKGPECPSLTKWKRQHPGETYHDLCEKNPELRLEIRKFLLKEQHGLCAFCCDQVVLESGRNAHLKPQSKYPHESLNWENIVASCPKPDSCDIFQGRKPLPISPLMEDCESKFKFYETGEIVGLDSDAEETIKNLNLDNSILRRRRSLAIQALCYENGIDPLSDIFSSFNDDEKRELIKKLETTDEDGNLPAFLPILISIINAEIKIKNE